MGVARTVTKEKQKKKPKKKTDLLGLLDSVFILAKDKEEAKKYAELLKHLLDNALNKDSDEKEYEVTVIYSQRTEYLWEIRILARLFGDIDEEIEVLVEKALKLVDLDLDSLYEEVSRNVFGNKSFCSKRVKEVILNTDASKVLENFAREIEADARLKLDHIRRLLAGVDTIQARILATLSKQFTVTKEDALNMLFHDYKRFLKILNTYCGKRVFLSRSKRLRSVFTQAVELSDKELTIVEDSLSESRDHVSILDISKLRRAGRDVLLAMQGVTAESIFLAAYRDFIALQINRIYDITSFARCYLLEVDEGKQDPKQIIMMLKHFLLEIDEREAQMRQLLSGIHLRWIDARKSLYRTLQKYGAPRIYLDLIDKIDDEISKVQEAQEEFYKAFNWSRSKIKEYFDIIWENKERLEKLQLIKKGYTIYLSDEEIGGEIGAILGMFNPKGFYKRTKRKMEVHPNNGNDEKELKEGGGK